MDKITVSIHADEAPPVVKVWAGAPLALVAELTPDEVMEFREILLAAFVKATTC